MASDMFLSFKNPVIKGESTDGVHKDEIDVLSWSWGASQSGTRGQGGGGGAGKVQVSDFSFQKYIDKASPTLFQKCCEGFHIDGAILTVRKAGGKAVEYLTVKFNKVIITSVTSGGAKDQDCFSETVTLNFESFSIDYKAQKVDGTPDAPVTGTFNMATNASS